MKRFLFVITTLLMIFTCISCEPKPTGGFNHIYKCQIDSAAICCGVDSFVIKSHWIQERINTYLADSATHKQELYTGVYLDCFTDSIGNDFIIDGGTILYDCDGVFITDLSVNDSMAVAIHETYSIHRLVHIVMGFLPNI